MLLSRFQDFFRASWPKIKLLPFIFCLTFPGFLLAQQVPDAGSLLREQNQATPGVVPPVDQTPNIELPQVVQTEASGSTLVVQGFAFSGNTLVSSAELNSQLNELLGQELTLADLQNLSLILTGYYASQGYLARFVLPPQEIENGVVRFDVVEGVRGDIRVASQGERINADLIESFISARSKAGEPMDMNSLGEALNILNEQPGISVSTSLQPGTSEREIGLNVAAEQTPLVSYRFGVNNYSAKGTGQNQAVLGVSVTNLTGNFDLLDLGLSKSEGTTTLNASYGRALGDRGLRFNLDASILDYELTQSDFAALQAEGDALTLGVGFSYPLSRQVLRGADVSARLEQRKLEDNTVSGRTGDRRVRALNLGWSGYQQLLEGWYSGTVTGGLSFVLGETDQKNAAARAIDANSRDINGVFAKIGFNLSHLKPLADDWSLVSTISGQIANKNLDSSARFSLGGPSGVRGFPVSEATGDEGYLVNLALRHQVSAQGSIGGFLDYGRIHINHEEFNLASTSPNWYSLSSLGMNLAWQFDQNLNLSAMLAHPLSNNPGANAQGEDSDGRKRGTRFWFSLSAQF